MEFKTFTVSVRRMISVVLTVILSSGILTMALAGSVSAAGTISVCGYLKSYAVYQQNKPMGIWGTASNGTSVTAELWLDSKKVATKTVTAANGKWSLTLPGQKGSDKAYTVNILSGSSAVSTSRNIVFGEVWLASGQSNMQFRLADSAGGKELITNANNQNIRIFQTTANPLGNSGSSSPANDIAGSWRLGNSPSSLSTVSAVAYSFALKLYAKLKVPVAIVETSLGSSTIETWLSSQMVDGRPELKAKLSGLGVYTQTPATWNEMGSMCNSKILPLGDLSIAGTIWYQGEGNLQRADVYSEELDLLKEEWGKLFGFENDSMPLIFSQLAPMQYNGDANQLYLTRMMDAMTEVYNNNSSSCAMIPIYDQPLDYTGTTLAMGAVIHPTHKKELGERMAAAALGLVYGSEKATAPIFESFKTENNGITVTFKEIGSGLETIGDSTGVLGFTLCSSYGVWVNADAKITGKNTVFVSNPKLPDPVQVAYAYNSFNTDANLCGSNGIPVAPFKSGGSGGFGNRSFLNCDGETWVHIDNISSDTVFHAAYENLWSVAEGCKTSYDTSTRAQGKASLKIEYSASDSEAQAGYDIRKAQLYNLTGGLSKITGVTAKIKNGDGRSKSLRLAVGVSGDTLVYTDPVTLPAGGDFQEVYFDLTSLKSADGSKAATAEANCHNALCLSFFIDDGQEGTIWIDDLLLSTKTDGKAVISDLQNQTDNIPSEGGTNESADDNAVSGNSEKKTGYLIAIIAGTVILFAAGAVVILNRIRKRTAANSVESLPDDESGSNTNDTNNTVEIDDGQ